MNKIVFYGGIFLSIFCIKFALADENSCPDIPSSLAEITHVKVDSYNEIYYTIKIPHEVDEFILDRVILSRKVNRNLLIYTEVMHREIEEEPFEVASFGLTPLKNSKVFIKFIYINHEQQCARTMPIEIK